jgi:predicted ester cyclase
MPHDTERYVAIMREFYGAFETPVGAERAARLHARYFDESEQLHVPGQGVKDFRYHEETEYRVFGAFPDLTMRVDDIFGADDKVVARFTLTGTNTGPLFGLPPTGREVVMTGIGIYRFAPHGRIVEEWYENDAIGQMRQLGLLPAGA